MHVALFGGSFNPPHVAHQMVALYVLETRPVDELWFVPALVHAFGKPLAPFADRLRMCQLAAAALGERVRVSDVESRLDPPSRTLQMVERLRQETPHARFSLIIGSDLVAEIDHWYGAETLRRTVPIIEVGRSEEGTTPATEGRPSAPVAPSTGARIKMPAVSSTEIRARLATGDHAGEWVPKAVLDYITSRGLYGSPATT
jgi:nicotinate-nucleotide adenylyltransferase